MTCGHCGGRVVFDEDPYDPRRVCLNCGRGVYLPGGERWGLSRPGPERDGGVFRMTALGRTLPKHIDSADRLPRIKR